MGGAMFPLFFLTWGQTMVEVMKIMLTSFKSLFASIASLSVPDPAAGHHWPRPPQETPGHSWASLGQSLVQSLLLSPESWYIQGFVCALQESLSPVLCKFWLSYIFLLFFGILYTVRVMNLHFLLEIMKVK